MATSESASIRSQAPSSPVRRRGFSLRNQVRYGTLGLVLLSVLLTGSSIIALSFRTQQQQIERTLQAESRAAATNLAAYMDDLQRKLEYLARVRGLVEVGPAMQANLLEGLARHNEAYELLAILDSTGHVLTARSRGTLPVPESLAHAPGVRLTLLDHAEYVGPVEKLTIDQQTLPVVTIVVPIRNQQDMVAGVLLARINLSFLWFVISQVDMGATGYAYITDNQNYLVAKTGSSPTTFEPLNLNDQPFFQHLLRGELAPGMPYVGLAEREVLGAATRIPSMGWQVVVELPTQEAYAPIQRMLWTMGALLGATMVLAVVIGLLFARQLVQPLQRLTAAAEQLRGGQFGVQVPVQSGNEIGILSAAFNTMGAQVQSSIRQLTIEQTFTRTVLDSTAALIAVLDAQGRIVRVNRTCSMVTGREETTVQDTYFWDLFATPGVADRLQAIVADLAAGATDAVDDEFSWLAADGELRLLSWSHRALRDDSGAVQQIISSGIDVTETRRATLERTELQERILRAQAEILSELSTPLIPIADDVLFLPLIGAVDTARAEQMLSVLLAGVERHRARIALIDISGVPTVDTQVAGILMRAARATQLLGAQMMITGIGPEIAETLIALGTDLRGIRTSSTLQQGIALALGGMVHSTAGLAPARSNGKVAHTHAFGSS